MQKNKTFYKIFISYLLIFIVPMSILGLVNYYKTLKIVQKNIEKDSMEVLEQASYILENRTNEIDKVSNEISVDSRVENFLITKALDTSETVLKSLDVINCLLGHTIVSDYIDEVYIYSNNNDVVLSSASLYSSQMFFTDILRNENMKYEQWLDYIKQPSFGKLAQNTVWKKGNIAASKMLYTRSIPSLGENFGSLMIFIDKQKYFNVLSNIAKKVNGYYYVLDENSQVIISNDEESNYSAMLENIRSGNSGTNYVKTKNGKALVIYTSSQKNNWKYITVIPNETFINQIKDVKESNLIAIFICIVVALILSLFATNNNYKNIKDLVNIIKRTYGTTNYLGDDFSFISNVLKSSYKEITSNRELLNSQIPFIRQSFLSNVLRESDSIDIDIESSTSSTKLLEIDLKFTYSTVLLVKILDSDSITSENNEYEIYKFAMRTTIEKCIGKNSTGYVLEIDNDKIAIIYGLKDDVNSNFQQEIFDFSVSLIQEITSTFHIAVSIGIGNIYSGYRNLNSSYQEALEAVDYAAFNNENIVFFKKINRNGKLFNFPIQKEVQLINYIKNCKKQQAVDIVDSVYEENIENKEITYEMTKLFILDLYCTIIKSLGEMKITDNSIIIDSMKVLDDQRVMSADMSYILNTIKDTIVKICDFIESQKKDTSLILKNKVIDFIEINFTDNQISLDAVASNFNITPQYLSKFFKEHIGINYVEYINSKRIEKAKEYLLSNEAVKDAAVKVGFENMGNFIKVFKKLVGLTPSEYKQRFNIKASSF